MKISDLIKQLTEIKEKEGDLYITGSDYDKDKYDLWIYVSKPTEDEDNTLGTFLVIELIESY